MTTEGKAAATKAKLSGYGFVIHPENNMPIVPHPHLVPAEAWATLSPAEKKHVNGKLPPSEQRHDKTPHLTERPA